MNQCNTAAPAMQKLDPTKRVNYTAGLVLGVDEFQQEQYYFIEKTRWHNRFLHGYGTTSGLQVDLADTGGGGLEVRVSPGAGVNPRGQQICVPAQMCARLDTWLQSNQQALQAVFGVPPFNLSLCLVLCARECQTDTVPIPGEPCRSQQDAMAASRIADSFELKLCLDLDAAGSPPMVSPPIGSPPLNPAGLPCYRPSQREEQAVRDFGQLLEQIDIVGGAASYLTENDFENLVRSLLTPGGIGSPPMSSPVSPASPPGARYHLRPDEACDILRAGFLVWVTEVRPQLNAPDVPVACQPPQECCVLLATLNIPVTAAWQIGGAVTIDEAARPYLLDTRLLQELVICANHLGAGAAAAAGVSDTFATIFLTAPDTVRAWIHHPVPLTVPLAATAISVSGGAFTAPLSIAQPLPGINIFDLRASAAITANTAMAVRFDAAQIANAADPGKSLKGALDSGAFTYADRQGDSLLAFGSGVRSVSAHSALTGLTADDHPQYLRTDGTRALAGTWSAGNNRITTLAAAIVAGDAVRFEQAVKNGDPATGDLGGVYPAPLVVKLQGRNLSPAAPNEGDVLVFRSGQWTPGTGPFVSAPGGFYSIAAAGFFDVNGAPLQAPYNNLVVARAGAAGTGLYLLSGAWYTQPGANSRVAYIVKGMTQDIGAQAAGGVFRATVEFVSFTDRGIQVHVQGTEGRERNFMVEISRYGG